MTNFSAEWLALREAADRRARHRGTADAVAAHFMQRDHLQISDLGSGSGANLRALAPLLPARQRWVLSENNPALITAGRTALAAWADSSSETDGGLSLHKDGLAIDVTYLEIDLAHDLEKALDPTPDLITASALFDLTSAAFIRRVVLAAAANRSALYAVLSYNGAQRWTPHRPADNRITAAFNQHQLTNKGFGPSAGPMAASDLADQLQLADYIVHEGASPWRLGLADAGLIARLVRDQAALAADLKALDGKTLETWTAVTRTAAEIGHTDVFGIPPKAAPRDDSAD